jgi:hypothetical protein
VSSEVTVHHTARSSSAGGEAFLFCDEERIRYEAIIYLGDWKCLKLLGLEGLFDKPEID